jgi:hypothetical protein
MYVVLYSFSQSQIPIERISLDKRKAGLQQVDANRVNKIIYEMSKVHSEHCPCFPFFLSQYSCFLTIL